MEQEKLGGARLTSASDAESPASSLRTHFETTDIEKCRIPDDDIDPLFMDETKIPANVGCGCRYGRCRRWILHRERFFARDSGNGIRLEARETPA